MYDLILSFFIYGFLGWCVEVGFAAVKDGRFVNRGFLNGPICPIYGFGVVAVVQFLAPFKTNLILMYVFSVILVTILEGVTGFAMDKIFHNKWWDYSDQPLNIGGYVCLLFSLVWGVACVLIVEFVHPVVLSLLSYLPEPVGIFLIVVLGTILLTDLYVTAAGIFKFNKRLEHMERIADELHQLSDQIGEDISKGVLTVSEDLAERAVELKEYYQKRKEYYQEYSEKAIEAGKRLVKAFPKMTSQKYTAQLEELKEKINGRLRK